MVWHNSRDLRRALLAALAACTTCTRRRGFARRCVPAPLASRRRWRPHCARHRPAHGSVAFWRQFTHDCGSAHAPCTRQDVVPRTPFAPASLHHARARLPPPSHPQYALPGLVPLVEHDPEMADLIEREKNRQWKGLELIASEVSEGGSRGRRELPKVAPLHHLTPTPTRVLLAVSLVHLSCRTSRPAR